MSSWQANAPSNIAIIKYMGKLDHKQNQASNASLSMTLSAFQSSVEIQTIDGDKDRWEPMNKDSDLPASAGDRFLRFLLRLKAEHKISANFLVRSKNNFPADCGLASSASSFAAYTKAIFKAFAALKNQPELNNLQLANISRTGSGSSCRSFFAPWCAWEGERVFELEHNFDDLIDLVVISDAKTKKVSSSEAHVKVQQSPLFYERDLRVQKRMEDAKLALHQNNFKSLAEIAWTELWEMHSMFHTSNPPFFYFSPQSLEVLRFAEDFWEQNNFGPMATVDAGPNVHLLVKKSAREEIFAKLREQIGENVKIMESGA